VKKTREINNLEFLAGSAQRRWDSTGRRSGRKEQKKNSMPWRRPFAIGQP
jgi:hypothetical protein